MPVDKYFDKFPIITYSNNQVVDITKRVVVLDRISENPYIFYPYELESNERADQFSARYYNDSFKSWIVYLSNNIIDPYHEWYMSDREFDDFIIKKYGSIPDAIQKIKYYRNNWENHLGEEISISQFNAMTAGQKNYWEPIFLSYDRIKSYKRKQNNWVRGTNQIVKYTVAANKYQLNALKEDELVTIYLNDSYYGGGQILKVDPVDSQIYLKHVKGYYKPTDEIPISELTRLVSRETNMNIFVADISVAADNIPDDEKIYWDGVSYYDYESEKNQYNKSIRVIDSTLSSNVVNNLKDLMKEPF